jgi:addiction module HigA family antidote
MLLEEYLKPLNIGQVEAARPLGVSLNRLNEIVLGKRGITADTALRYPRVQTLRATRDTFREIAIIDHHLQNAGSVVQRGRSPACKSSAPSDRRPGRMRTPARPSRTRSAQSPLT